jgi:hypothetical protein
LEKNYFRALDPARGRSRGFLCASVRHFSNGAIAPGR